MNQAVSCDVSSSFLLTRKACETSRDWLRALELLEEMKDDHLLPNRVLDFSVSIL